MDNQLIFQDETEMQRLHVQNNLLSSYEEPILARLFSGREDIAVLDVGCNNGSKTVQRFSSPSLSRVIGIEYNEMLAKKAQEQYGGKCFSFFRCDVEAEEFPSFLKGIMEEKGIGGFDLIYLSFLLMHLSAPEKFLLAIRPFLKKNGKILIVEADDSASFLKNDESGLLQKFLSILSKDKYAGNREVGKTLVVTLEKCGYSDISVHHHAIRGEKGEMEKKDAIFTTFFSYLPQDVDLLLSSDPDHKEYREWKSFLSSSYSTLKEMVTDESSEISMGMKILTCSKGCDDE